MDTLKYVLKRLLFAFINFVIIMSAIFVLIRMLDYGSGASSSAAETERLLKEAMGYNKPIVEQWLIYIKKIITEGNWGVSFRVQPYYPVMEVLTSRLLPTVLLNIYTIIVAIPVGILFGVYAALKKNKWQDHVISTGVMIFISLPGLIVAFLMIYFFSFKLQWFPSQLLPLENAGNSWFSPAMTRSFVLPVFMGASGIIAGLTRNMRAELTEVLTSDYMLLARTKGLTRAQATMRHSLKNALVPILPGIVAMCLGILGGSLITERVFGIPGVGGLGLRAIEVLDYDLIVGVMAFYTSISLVSGIVVDLSFGFLDPRVRVGSRKG